MFRFEMSKFNVKLKLVNWVWELYSSKERRWSSMSWKTFKFFDKEVLKDPETKQPYQDLAVRAGLAAAGGRLRQSCSLAQS